ncbi:hypothetical protein UY3_11212 [Chelonia mydas]|uniref:Uncharacterized protein n=1 Tax=Chelonia mydas TaxID=8469 RepID=M7BHU7_CHEMY|nr:hypothetical protein UY3_11212 [Chelonia mydas]
MDLKLSDAVKEESPESKTGTVEYRDINWKKGRAGSDAEGKVGRYGPVRRTGLPTGGGEGGSCSRAWRFKRASGSQPPLLLLPQLRPESWAL